MKKILSSLFLAVALLTFSEAVQAQDRYVSSKTHIKFFSTTPVEDIEANNYASVSTIVPSTGDVVFSVPIQSFEFEKAMMQEHFNNEHFLESSVYPKSKFKATILNLDEIDFTKNGEYQAEIQGQMTIKDKTNTLKEWGTITVEDQSLTVSAVFDLVLADYGITFADSEMVATKIGKSVEITITAVYNSK
ncbi:MAG: YceI family protein [Bacteroidetes bacterium]|nr:MAG: YceI family protein [Bacteroidota bacterium]